MTASGAVAVGTSGPPAAVVVRTAEEGDLPRADAVLRAAFDAFTGRTGHVGDSDPLGSRWRTDRRRVVVAELEGRVVGSNAITVRGTTGWFGPLSVDPRLWGRGLAHPLVDEALDRLRGAGVDKTGLFTFAGSSLHRSLYARHGFQPGAPMLVLARRATRGPSIDGMCHSTLPAQQQAALLDDLAVLTDVVEPGWDLRLEVTSTSRAALGDTVVLHDAAGLAGAAIVQSGPGSEAGGTCRVKVAVVRPGQGAEDRMTCLLDRVDMLALRRGAPTVVATVSAANQPFVDLLRERGHVLVTEGVAMHRGGVGHQRHDAWVLDDWR